MKKTILILFLFFANIIHAQNDAALYKDRAMSSFLSKDYTSANQYFAKLHAVEGNYMDFEDLFTYYLSAEKVNDSILCKNLLFEIVQHNYFERYNLPDSIIIGFDLKNRYYWNTIDSIIVQREQEMGKYRPYIDSLSIMVKNDISIRREAWSEERDKKMHIVDSVNTAKLKCLIQKYGFPTWKLVGRSASDQAWLIAQHSDKQFMAKFIKSYRTAVKENNANKQHLALMEDRVRMNDRRPQLYGSQLFGFSEESLGFYPIGNMKDIDCRRRSVGLKPIKEYAKSFGLDSVVINPYYSDYFYYYKNLCAAYQANLQKDFQKVASILQTGSGHYPFAKDLKLLYDAYLSMNDTVNAIATARQMVLCGFDIESDNLFWGFIHDTLVAESEFLLEEYTMQLDQNGNAYFDSTCSFNDAKELIDTQNYPRYSIDAWNNVLPSLIKKESANVGIDDYQHFFAWLYDQVVVGNFHLFDYAELYDEVYFRLYGSLFYGQSVMDSVPIYQYEKLDERRESINLPNMKTWCQIQNMEILTGRLHIKK